MRRSMLVVVRSMLTIYSYLLISARTNILLMFVAMKHAASGKAYFHLETLWDAPISY
jgi:hypothetical protein